MSSARALAGVILPIYLSLIGFSATRLGLLFMVVAIVSAFLSTLVGTLSDRVGRKIFMVIIPWFTSISALALAFSANPILIFLLAPLGSLGRGSGVGIGMVGPYQPAEQALTVESVAPSERNKAFGRLFFASSFGALFGGLLALLIPHAHLSKSQVISTYRPEFLFIAILAFLSGAMALKLQEPAKPKTPKSKTLTKKRQRHKLSKQTKELLKKLWLTNTLNGVAVGLFGPFITYWFYKRYGVGPAQIGILFALINLATMGASLSAARIAHSLGTVRVVTVARVIQGLLLIPMVLSPYFWLAGVIYLIRTISQRIALPLRQSFVTGIAPPDERSTLAALSNLPAQVASSITPGIGGYLLESISLDLPFEIAGVLQMINALSFYVFFKNTKTPEEDLDSEKLKTQEIKSNTLGET